MQKKQITIAVAGFGLRARDYTQYVTKNPDRAKVVAIAEIDEKRRRDAAAAFGVPSHLVFDTAEEMLTRERLADCMFITTQDRQHVPMALMALEKGYDILMEKPISPSLQECLALRDAAHRAGSNVTVCHVLRYTKYFQTIRETITSGIIGEVQNIAANENVGYFHQAHSFVRGNWRRSEDASPMIMAKCCHDLDILAWLMGKSCTHISSFGSLDFFREDRAPKGAAKRCLDGCQAKQDCPYDAEKIYVFDETMGVIAGKWKWPCNAIAPEHTEESVYKALREGPYGRCVFHCDNDVVDRQIVNMLFEDGATASLSMCAFTAESSRDIKIMGTLGEITGNMEENSITVHCFGKPAYTMDIEALVGSAGDGHAGGDAQMIASLVETLSGDRSAQMLSSIDQSVESHVMALAAEHSRLNAGCSISLSDFEAQCQGEGCV